MNRKKLTAALVAVVLSANMAVFSAGADDVFSAADYAPAAVSESGDIVTFNAAESESGIDPESLEFFDGYTTNNPIFTPEVRAYNYNGTIGLYWDNVHDCKYYRVFYRKKGTSKWTSFYSVNNSCYINGLTLYTEYEFLVLSSNGNAWSKWDSSNITTATPREDGISSRYFYLEPGNNSVYVYWYPEANIRKCKVLYRLKGTAKWSYADVTSDRYNVTGLTNGKEYEFLVRLYDGKSWSSWTEKDIKTATPEKGEEQTFEFTAEPGNNHIYTNWKKIKGAEKYMVFIRPSGTSKWVIKLQATSDSTGYGYGGKDITNGTKYDVLMRYYMNGKWSSFTSADIKQVTPSATAKPRYMGFTAVPGNSRIIVNINTVVKKSRVFYRVKGASKWATIDTTSDQVIINNLKNGTEYEVLVRGSNGGAWSDYHDYDIDTVTPCTDFYTPKISAYTATLGDYISVDWDYAPNAVKYKVFYRVHGTSKWQSLVTNKSGAGFAAKKGYKYDVLVRSFDGAKYSSYTASDILLTDTVTYLETPDIRATYSDNGTCYVYPETIYYTLKYRIFYRVRGTSKWSYKDLNGGYESFCFEGIPGNQYEVLLLASDGKTWSAYDESNIITMNCTL